MRNNTNRIFMFAYMVFIFIVASSKKYLDSDIWNHIVVAITVTSSLIAISDFMRTFSVAIDSVVSDLEEPVNEHYRIIKAINNKSSYLDSFAVDEDGTNRKEELEEWLNDQEMLSQETLVKIDNIKRHRGYLSKSATITLFLAFLFFFCILSFKSIFSYFLKYIDEMTITAFGCILLGQLLSSYFEEKLVGLKDNLLVRNSDMDIIKRYVEKEAAKNAD